MSSIDEAKQKLNELKQKSKFKKMVGVAAVLTELLQTHHIKPVIDGGLAVEIYTRGDYTTVDIDVIISDRHLAADLLRQLDFIKAGRHLYHETLMVSIEIPSNVLEDPDENRIIQLELEDKQKVYVIGIEDIILDRLRACVHWRSTSDCEWGRRMLLLHRERLDMAYVKKSAARDSTAEKLQDWVQTE
ncbi:DUF6036 family nucleotidyltransferase [Virgibacillus kimchii]